MQIHSVFSLRTKYARLLALVIVFAGVSHFSAFSQNPPPKTQPEKPHYCKVWDYPYLTGTINYQTGPHDWDAWHVLRFPKNCYWETDTNIRCYWDDPNDACAAYTTERAKLQELDLVAGGSFVPLRIHPKVKGGALTYPLTTYTCTFTYRVRGRVINGEQVNVATAGDIGVDTLCNTTNAAGPYRNCKDARKNNKGDDVSFGTVPGKPFDPQKQRPLILGLNKARHQNKLMSDVSEAAYKQLDPEYDKTPCAELTDPALATASDPCAAEVHHMVPKRDKQGCPCGSNSFKNAIVIPRQLNKRIGNDFDRAALLIQLASRVRPYSDNGLCSRP